MLRLATVQTLQLLPDIDFEEKIQRQKKALTWRRENAYITTLANCERIWHCLDINVMTLSTLQTLQLRPNVNFEEWIQRQHKALTRRRDNAYITPLSSCC